MTLKSLILPLALSGLLMGSLASAACVEWEAGPLDNGTTPNGSTTGIYVTTTWDPDGAGPLPSVLVAAGNFTSIEGVAANHVAYRDPATGLWHPLGSGVSKIINALTVYNGQLVVGGQGDNDPSSTDDNIQYWDGSAWHTFYGGTSTGNVLALYVYNGQLYAGGNFVIYPTVLNVAHNIARWNPGAGLWEEVDSGTDNTVYAMTQFGSDLLVGGTFTHAGGGLVNFVAKWNSSTHWSAYGSGLSSGVSAMGVFGGQLLVNGSWNTSPAGFAPGVAAWNGASWVPFGIGMDSNVGEIAIYNGQLVAGGYFTHADNQPANRVAYWNGSSWKALLTGVDANVYDLHVYNSELIVCGAFTHADGRTANQIARWNGEEWGSFGGGGGANGYVLAMASFNGSQVAAGVFHQNTSIGNMAHFIATWNGTSLSNFGTGMDGGVASLLSFTYPGIFGAKELVAGGTFTHAGGVVATRVARWTQPFVAFPPPAWEGMGSGFNGEVDALERFSGVTYAGGSFSASGATTTSFIAKWNETSNLWEAVGTGMDGQVLAMKSYGGYLYVGGTFTHAGGNLTGGLARWNGTIWAPVGGTFSGTVSALEVHNGQLVMGGHFPGINSSPNLAQYNGTTYSTFSTGGADQPVYAIHSTGARLYIGGGFLHAGGIPAQYIAYWDGSWHQILGGTESVVSSLGYLSGKVQVGGYFSSVGSSFLPSKGWAFYSESGAPVIGSQSGAQTVATGSTVNFVANLAAGSTADTYRWYRNSIPLSDGSTGTGSNISGSSTSSLQLDNVSHADSALYQAILTNSCGSDSTIPELLTVTAPAGVGSPGGLGSARFESVRPNPTGGVSRVTFSLPREAGVLVRVHDVTGRVVRVVDAGRWPAGEHQVTWDGRGSDGQRVASGLYLVKLEVDGQNLGTRRLIVTR